MYTDEDGCIYCKKIHGLIQILPLRTPCLQCEKCRGSIQGEGCECAWADFDFETGQIVSVFDHIAEYDRINTFKTVSKAERLCEWEKKNKEAGKRYQSR